MLVETGMNYVYNILISIVRVQGILTMESSPLEFRINEAFKVSRKITQCFTPMIPSHVDVHQVTSVGPATHLLNFFRGLWASREMDNV